MTQPDLLTYPDAPGYKAPGPSQIAASHAQSRCAELRRLVLELLAVGNYTCGELATLLSEDITSIRPRVSQLKAKGKVIDSGVRRRSAMGEPETVWRVA